MKTALLIILTILVMGCDEKIELGLGHSIVKEIEPVLIAKGHLNYNDIFPKEQHVITSSGKWNLLINNMNSINDNISTSFEELDIDFEKFICLAIFDIKNSTTTVDIVNIIEYEDKIIVKVDNLTIGIDQSVHHPFHIVKIPASKKPIAFE